MSRTMLASDPAYLKAAFSRLGVSEIEGARHEKLVLDMYAASGHSEIHDDETPWCAAFVGWSLEKGGLVGTHSLMAISYAKYGNALDRNKTIPRGAIAVWKRTGGAHVNFVLEDDGTYVTCIGGNQENGKGGGVTISRRLKSQAVAYRLPKGAKADPKPPVRPSVPIEPESPVEEREVPATPMARTSKERTSEAPTDAPKSMAESKTGNIAVLGGAGGVLETIRSGNDIASEVASAKDNADTLGLPHWLAVLWNHPEFLIALVVIGAAVFVWFDHRKYKRALAAAQAGN